MKSETQPDSILFCVRLLQRCNQYCDPLHSSHLIHSTHGRFLTHLSHCASFARRVIDTYLSPSIFILSHSLVALLLTTTCRSPSLTACCLSPHCHCLVVFYPFSSRSMSTQAVTRLSLCALTTRRVFAYLRHHGPLRGTRQLFGVFRQLHELRLGDFKGRDPQGNELYEDRYAGQENKRRFVVYANSQTNTQQRDKRTTASGRSGVVHSLTRHHAAALLVCVSAADYDATDISPEWHGWLHRIYEETPVEVETFMRTSKHHHCKPTLITRSASPLTALSLSLSPANALPR